MNYMLKRLLQLNTLLLGAALFTKVAAQGFTLSDWTTLSEDNSKTTLTDTVFLDKRCVKLDGKSIAAIWNKNMNLKNFRIEFDMAGSVMGGLCFMPVMNRITSSCISGRAMAAPSKPFSIYLSIMEL